MYSGHVGFVSLVRLTLCTISGIPRRIRVRRLPRLDERLSFLVIGIMMRESTGWDTSVIQLLSVTVALGGLEIVKAYRFLSQILNRASMRGGGGGVSLVGGLMELPSKVIELLVQVSLQLAVQLVQRRRADVALRHTGRAVAGSVILLKVSNLFRPSHVLTFLFEDTPVTAVGLVGVHSAPISRNRFDRVMRSVARLNIDAGNFVLIYVRVSTVFSEILQSLALAVDSCRRRLRLLAVQPVVSDFPRDRLPQLAACLRFEMLITWNA